MIAHINIGSNRGDSMALIGQAVAAIASHHPGASVRVSDPFVSPPWGFESEHDFTNVGVALEVPDDTDPQTLMDELLNIQGELSAMPHRNPDGTYRDRELDIDLIALGEMVLDTARLILPHPRMHLRPFVLVPLAQLAPSWRHPHLHLTASELLAEL